MKYVYHLEEQDEAGNWVRLKNADYYDQEEACNRASMYNYNEGRRMRVVHVIEEVVREWAGKPPERNPATVFQEWREFWSACWSEDRPLVGTAQDHLEKLRERAVELLRLHGPLQYKGQTYRLLEDDRTVEIDRPKPGDKRVEDI